MDTFNNTFAVLLGLGVVLMVIQIARKWTQLTAVKRKQGIVTTLAGALVALSTPLEHAGRTNGLADALRAVIDVALIALMIYWLVLWAQDAENKTPTGGA